MSAPSPALRTPHTAPLTPARLADIARGYAARSDLWRPKVRFTTPDRWYARLDHTDTFEVWLLTWLPGQGTEIHDHGGSSGAFTVVDGTLTERSFGDLDGDHAPVSRALATGELRSFGPRYVHEVTNRGTRPAVSVHAYGPALATQSFYAWESAGLRLLRTDAVED
ncbi:cysteine dioxygenase family protein [Streptomyces sp. RFCAC02]|uniref:cysteine dioxygenase n=1 Tax=Streptomyces sp. RFCAC02 TaxID=2499143 RepID=UPI0010208D9E|nr:cysteine dioxygenase family protein [Streptomyces sp. RFCAC02]